MPTFTCLGKLNLTFSTEFVVCNPCQYLPSLTILVPLWFIIISLVFFYLSMLLFSGLLQFKGNFVRGQNTTTELFQIILKKEITEIFKVLVRKQ